MASARKYLTELLVNNLKINCEECIDKIDDVIDKIKLGLLYGQIKTVIKIANENNLPFIALMLSKLNDSKGKSVFQKQLNIFYVRQIFYTASVIDKKTGGENSNCCVFCTAYGDIAREFISALYQEFLQ